MKSLRIAYLSIIFMILCLPVSQMVLHIFPKQPLNGVQKQAETPVLSLAAVFHSRFQDDFTKWFDQNFGMRGYLVKTNNQILYSLFREAGPSGENIVFGKQQQLFAKNYIDSYLGNNILPMDLLDEQAARIKELQDLLADRGICFTIFLTPSKASIYPEYIPDRLLTGSARPVNPNTSNFILSLRKHNVNYVDSISLLQKFKRSSDVPLFPRGGLHWNQMGAYFALEQLLAEICKIGGHNIGKIEVEDVKYVTPWGGDRDLVDLLNVWAPPLDYSAPELKLRLVPSNMNPKMLFVGGSFNYLVLGMLSSVNLPSSLAFLTYYNYKVSYPDPKLIHHQIDKLDWENEIFGNDVIVLEINELYASGNFDTLCSGFARDALIKLKKLELATKH